MFDSAI